jgi:hypothetical protein
MRELEEKLLLELSSVQGNILDDDTIIVSLEKLKKETAEVSAEARGTVALCSYGVAAAHTVPCVHARVWIHRLRTRMSSSQTSPSCRSRTCRSRRRARARTLRCSSCRSCTCCTSSRCSSSSSSSTPCLVRHRRKARRCRARVHARVVVASLLHACPCPGVVSVVSHRLLTARSYGGCRRLQRHDGCREHVCPSPSAAGAAVRIRGAEPVARAPSRAGPTACTGSWMSSLTVVFFAPSVVLPVLTPSARCMVASVARRLFFSLNRDVAVVSSQLSLAARRADLNEAEMQLLFRGASLLDASAANVAVVNEVLGEGVSALSQAQLKVWSRGCRCRCRSVVAHAAGVVVVPRCRRRRACLALARAAGRSCARTCGPVRMSGDGSSREGSRSPTHPALRTFRVGVCCLLVSSPHPQQHRYLIPQCTFVTALQLCAICGCRRPVAVMAWCCRRVGGSSWQRRP